MDKISPEKRSRNMSHIRAKDTKPELLVRKALFKQGLRYKIHYHLPGKPDIVFPSKKIVIFIHGCFWHGHKCKLDHSPKTNKYFWMKKITNNILRDKSTFATLNKLGWKVIIIWECDIENHIKNIINKLIRIIV